MNQSAELTLATARQAKRASNKAAPEAIDPNIGKIVQIPGK